MYMQLVTEYGVTSISGTQPRKYDNNGKFDTSDLMMITVIQSINESANQWDAYLTTLVTQSQIPSMSFLSMSFLLLLTRSLSIYFW